MLGRKPVQDAVPCPPAIAISPLPLARLAAEIPHMPSMAGHAQVNGIIGLGDDDEDVAAACWDIKRYRSRTISAILQNKLTCATSSVICAEVVCTRASVQDIPVRRLAT